MIKQQLANFVRCPDSSYQWSAVQAISCADDIGRRRCMEDEFTAIDKFANDESAVRVGAGRVCVF